MLLVMIRHGVGSNTNALWGGGGKWAGHRRGRCSTDVEPLHTRTEATYGRPNVEGEKRICSTHVDGAVHDGNAGKMRIYRPARK